MDGDASFGHWLRLRRKVLQLSCAELARRVSCATITLRKIEADERRPSRQLAAQLAAHLDIPASERAIFIRVARGELKVDRLMSPAQPAGHTPSPTASLPQNSRVSHRHNLPAQLTGLIGREREVAEICALLRMPDARLLTLSGPGGSGKTRLALQAASELLGNFPDGVFFVNLAPIGDPELVTGAIAQVLGIREVAGRALSDLVKAYVQEKCLLLLLDNFEHVIPAAPMIATLLAAAPRLQVLVTSRAALRIYGERAFAVPPLENPQRGRLPDLDRLVQYPAVRLFVERARAVKADFAITRANAYAVVEICQRLDGLPLAIELAAARIRLLTPPKLLERLERRLPLLTSGEWNLPPRQQTLQTTIEWSYHLLDADQQALFAQLAVFAGGCTLEAVEAVCGDLRPEWMGQVFGDQPPAAEAPAAVSILDGLGALLDNSLLRQIEGRAGEPRYTMLETMREYALEQLEQRGEGHTLHQRHAAYYLALAETAAPLLHGAEQLIWLDRLEAEHDNLRAALIWSQASAESRAPGSSEAAEHGLRLAVALTWFWLVRGYWSEGRTWLAAALARCDTAAARLRATALNGLGDLATWASDSTAARGHFQASLAIGREIGDTSTIAAALRGLGLCALWQSAHDYDNIQGMFDESLTYFQYLNDDWNVGMCMYCLGMVAHKQRAYERAYVRHEASLALFRRLHDHRGMTLALIDLAKVARRQGDYTRAEAYSAESLALATQLRDRAIRADALGMLGNLARNRRNYDRAAAYYDESLALFRDVGDLEGVVSVLQDQGYLAYQQGDQAQAAVLLHEALALCRDIGYQWMSVWCLAGLGHVAIARGQLEHATRLLGATAALLEIFDPAMDPLDQADYKRSVDAARTQLDVTTFDALWAAGQAMSPEQAITYALERSDVGPRSLIATPAP